MNSIVFLIVQTSRRYIRRHGIRLESVKQKITLISHRVQSSGMYDRGSEGSLGQDVPELVKRNWETPSGDVNYVGLKQ